MFVSDADAESAREGWRFDPAPYKVAGGYNLPDSFASSNFKGGDWDFLKVLALPLGVSAATSLLGAGAAGSGLVDGLGAAAYEGAGAAAAGGSAVGSDAWWNEIMQNYNPNLDSEIGSGLKDLSTGPAQTNLQDMITKLDSTPAGKSYLNNLIGPNSDIASKLMSIPGGSSVLSRIINGSATSDDWLSTAGKIAATALGVIGSNNQAGQLNSLAQQYQGYGAPSRARYEAAMTPGFDPTTIPGYSGALDTTSKSVLAKLSASGGNPYGNPGGLIDANKQIVAGTALPAIQSYIGSNANVGFGAPMQATLGLQTQGVGADANTLNAIGYGINAISNPTPSLTDLIAQMNGKGYKFGNGATL